MPKSARQKHRAPVSAKKASNAYPDVWPDMPTTVPEAMRNPQACGKRLHESPLNGVPLDREARLAVESIDIHNYRVLFLENRHRWFGGTLIPKAFGRGFGSMTPYQSALIHTGSVVPKPFTKRGFQCCEMGSMFEPLVLQRYASKMRGCTVSMTGFHVMQDDQSWLQRIYDVHRNGKTAPNMSYMVVSPDALVTLPPIVTLSSGSSVFTDARLFSRHGRVEVKCHVNGIRSPWSNVSAWLQTLAQIFVDKKKHANEGENDESGITQDWGDLCSYSCVTKLSTSVFAEGRSSGVPMQQCGAWRITVPDESLWVDFADLIRKYYETLPNIKAYTAATFPLTKSSWRTLDLYTRSHCVKIFSGCSQSAPVCA